MLFAVVRAVKLDSTVTYGQISAQWLILWTSLEGMVAIIVGCLPSFAIFVRGRVQASRVRYPYNYPSYYNSNAVASGNGGSRVREEKQKSKFRTESVMLDEVEPGRPMAIGLASRAYTASKKSLVAAPAGMIKVTYGWSQNWQKGSDEDRDRERAGGLGFPSQI